MTIGPAPPSPVCAPRTVVPHITLGYISKFGVKLKTACKSRVFGTWADKVMLHRRLLSSTVAFWRKRDRRALWHQSLAAGRPCQGNGHLRAASTIVRGKSSGPGSSNRSRLKPASMKVLRKSASGACLAPTTLRMPSPKAGEASCQVVSR